MKKNEYKKDQEKKVLFNFIKANLVDNLLKDKAEIEHRSKSSVAEQLILDSLLPENSIARDIVSSQTVFTTHTPIPAGNDIFTMDLTRVKPEYTCIKDEQVEFLNRVVKSKNANNCVQKVDVTSLYEQEFMNCKNENAYCTPYTLLRLLADLVPNMPDKLLYLDIDMMANDDISKLYNKDITDYE